MKRTAHRASTHEAEPVRILGRGLRAQRGVRLTMRALREGAGRTQIDVAQAAQIDQSDISRLENKHDFDDCQVSTLRRYVDAIGGHLEIVASFGDKKIVLVGVEDRSAPISLERKRVRKTARKSKA